MVLTWLRYGHPDVSMTLNGSLAGLVAITAGCDAVSPAGSFFIGLIAGIVVVFAVEFIDQKLKVDDPVGAVAVHGVCGALGTILTGLFAVKDGLLYTGEAHFFLVQVLGVVENMSYLDVDCPHCGESHRVDVFGTGGGAEVASTLTTRLGYDIPLLAEVPLDPSWSVLDYGAGTGLLAFALAHWGTNFHQIIMDGISAPLADRKSVV